MEGWELGYFLMAVIPSGLIVFLLFIGDFEMDFEIGDFEVFSGPGPFGIKALLAFVAGFGLGGYASEYGDWPLDPYVYGFIFAIVFYTSVIVIMRFVYSQRSNSLKTTESLIGCLATVSVDITDQPGEVVATHPVTNSTVHMIARSTNHIEKGNKVKVVDIAMGTAYVEDV